jgi:hypothetical protein
MGVWEANTLANDDAGEFLSGLMGSRRRWWVVEQALRKASEKGGYLECRIAFPAIAAAEVVAAARFRHSEELEDDVVVWATHSPPRDIAILETLALAAIRRIASESEAKELSEGAGTLDVWLRSLQQLSERIAGPPGNPPQERKSRRRVRVRQGDVIQLSLPNGKYAYGRVGDGETIHVYSGLTDRPNSPPIGSRTFLFNRTGIVSLIKDGTLPIVGFDAWDNDEPGRISRCYTGAYPSFCLNDSLGNAKWVSAIECWGLSNCGWYDLQTFVDRILEGEFGRIAISEWPILPDEQGQLKRMRWEDWGPENEAKFKRENQQPIDRRAEIDELVKEYWGRQK